ncbi:MAG: hypothetical protein K8S00_12130 [Bacteroidales bacterium]|nr:hypothetical protein [Bacteroidales bacterium]
MLFIESQNTKAEQIKEFISVNVSTSFNNIEPYLVIGEREYIKPLLGTALFDLLDAYAADPTDDELWDELLSLARRALINLAFYRGYSMISIKISDAGVHRMETDHEKTLYKYQEQSIINTFKTDGFNGLDNVLEFCEDNIATFPDFESSESYTVFKSKFISKTSVFSEIFSINKSRLVFLRLQPYTTLVEDFEILPTIGRVLFDKLKAEIVKETPDEKLMKVVEFIQKAIAFLSVSKAIAEIGVNITEKAVYFETSQATAGDTIQQSTLSDKQIERISTNNKNTGLNYIQYLTDFLHENIADYPDYAEFYGYNDGEIIGRDNTDKKTFLT